MNKINPLTTYLLAFIFGIILGCVSYCSYTNKGKETKIKYIPVMSKPITVIDSVPYPIFVSKKSIIKDSFPYPIFNNDTTKCCENYSNLFVKHNELWNYADTMLRDRIYIDTINNSLITIIVKNNVLGKLTFGSVDFFIKPQKIIVTTKSTLSLFVNGGYDITTKNILIGTDLTKGKYSIGYMGNIKDENLIKLGYKLY